MSDLATAVKALHPAHTEQSGTVVCVTCLLPFPCPTVAAVDAHSLTGEEIERLFPGAVPCPSLGTLVCTRTTAHDPAGVGGHTYEATGSPDGHTSSEDAAERTRG